MLTIIIAVISFLFGVFIGYRIVFESQRINNFEKRIDENE